MRYLLITALAFGACGDNSHAPDYLGYDWDDRRVLCSDELDNLNQTTKPSFFHSQIEAAGRGGWALILHSHEPTVTISLDWLDQILTWADENGLEYFTFRDLVPDPGAFRPGLALAFDDMAPDTWLLARDTLARHGAHVTFFVSDWKDIPPTGHEEIAILHADGHDIEPHSVHHYNAKDYVAQHGVDAYVQDEVLPSFQVLIDAGYPAPSTFAYPFGVHTPEIDTAVLQVVDKVRTTPGQCPWAGWDL
jgi:peptidoglycan/xylan/chitin deacetylase (PgdA/CDA1 family)